MTVKEGYIQGSEGSLIWAKNPKKYDVTTLDEHAPAETPFPVEPPDHSLQAPAANEIVRRRSNRSRDNSRRFGIVNAPQGVANRNETPEKE